MNTNIAAADTYNGWASYDTWLVALALDNDPDVYQGVQELIADLTGMVEVPEIEEQIHCYIETRIRETSDGLAADLALSALDAVDWHELAQDRFSDLLTA